LPITIAFIASPLSIACAQTKCKRDAKGYSLNLNGLLAE